MIHFWWPLLFSQRDGIVLNCANVCMNNARQYVGSPHARTCCSKALSLARQDASIPCDALGLHRELVPAAVVVERYDGLP